MIEKQTPPQDLRGCFQGASSEVIPFLPLNDYLRVTIAQPVKCAVSRGLSS